MILQIGYGMIQMMLAKFMFNDLPHASGMIPHTRYDDPPTGPQLSHIARLCIRTHTTTIHEERVTTFGEAGRMIRELQAEEARQKRERKIAPRPREKPSLPPKIGAPNPARPRVPPSKIGAGVELPIPVGECFRDAGRYVVKEEEGYLVHGTVESQGKRIQHAWAETATGYIWEPQTKQYMTKEAWATYNPTENARYTAEEASIMMLREKNWGPWL